MNIIVKTCLDEKIEKYNKLYLEMNGVPKLDNISISKRINNFNLDSDLGCSYMGRNNLNQYQCMLDAEISESEINDNVEIFQEVFFKSRIVSCMNCEKSNCSVGKSELSKYLFSQEK